MIRTTYLKRFLLPGSVYAATVIRSGEGTCPGSSERDTATDAVAGTDSCNPHTGKLLRRSELPLYDDSPPAPAKVCEKEEQSSLEEGISAVRKELWIWHDKYEGYREKVVDVIQTGKQHTAVLIDQLRKDELLIPRSGAIAISGLTGLVFGLRGGWFKRIFYGSACAGLMAAVCYPKEVAEISEDTLAHTKKLILISYNFIYGVKPDGLKLPSPSQFLGGPPESPDKEKGDLKPSSTGVSEHEPEYPASPRPNDQSNPADKDLYSSRG